MAPLAMCYDPPLVRDKPLGAPAFVKLLYYTDGSLSKNSSRLAGDLRRHGIRVI